MCFDSFVLIIARRAFRDVAIVPSFFEKTLLKPHKNENSTNNSFESHCSLSLYTDQPKGKRSLFPATPPSSSYLES
jgi:hypothetical protein